MLRKQYLHTLKFATHQLVFVLKSIGSTFFTFAVTYTDCIHKKIHVEYYLLRTILAGLPSARNSHRTYKHFTNFIVEGKQLGNHWRELSRERFIVDLWSVKCFLTSMPGIAGIFLDSI